MKKKDKIRENEENIIFFKARIGNILKKEDQEVQDWGDIYLTQ